MAYITEVAADTYMTGRLNTNPWDNASSADKVAALTMATRAINRVLFIGEKTESTQADEFPRGDDTTVPEDIQNACAEEALALLDGKDPEMEYENLRLKSQDYAKTKSTYASVPLNIAAGIMSVTAWRLMLPFIRDYRTVDLFRA